MFEAIQQDGATVGQLVRDFLTETRNELFPTREACVAFYSHQLIRTTCCPRDPT